MPKICVFFGHRDLTSSLAVPLDCAIRHAILEHGITHFWYGGHGNFDRMAARAVVKHQPLFPDIRLELVRAYMPGKAEQNLPPYDPSIYPDGLEFVPQRFAISHRNRWMVQQCDLVICYVERSFGGVYEACRQAQRRDVPILNLAAASGSATPCPSPDAHPAR